MMKYFLRSLLLVLCFYKTIPGAAQPAPGIVHIYAFMTESQPGNIPVDDQGRPLHQGPDTSYTLVVETTGRDPQWTAAYIGGRRYDIACQPVEKAPFEAGTEKRSGKKFLLTPSKGHRLWELTLSPAAGKPAGKPVTQKMMLEGCTGRKKWLAPIDRVVELAGIPRP